MAPRKDFELDQGSTFSKFFRFVDANGDFENISGSTWNGQIRSNFTSSVAALLGVGINTASLGEIAIALTASASAAIPAGVYVYDIYQTVPGGRFRRLEGQIFIRPEVTRV